MKRLIILSLILISTVAFADDTETSLAILHQIPNAEFSVQNGKITKWRTQGTPRPSEAQITQYVSDYRAYLQSLQDSKDSKSSAVKTKLSLTDDDIEGLKELLK